MVDVAQLVEPRIVIPVVVGSSPIVHPILSAVAVRMSEEEQELALVSSTRSQRAVSSVGRAGDS